MKRLLILTLFSFPLGLSAQTIWERTAPDSLCEQFLMEFDSITNRAGVLVRSSVPAIKFEKQRFYVYSSISDEIKYYLFLPVNGKILVLEKDEPFKETDLNF